MVVPAADDLCPPGRLASVWWVTDHPIRRFDNLYNLVHDKAGSGRPGRGSGATEGLARLGGWAAPPSTSRPLWASKASCRSCETTQARRFT